MDPITTRSIRIAALTRIINILPKQIWSDIKNEEVSSLINSVLTPTNPDSILPLDNPELLATIIYEIIRGYSKNKELKIHSKIALLYAAQFTIKLIVPSDKMERANIRGKEVMELSKYLDTLSEEIELMEFLPTASIIELDGPFGIKHAYIDFSLFPVK